MSAFLGPIHSLMYDRIITCQKVINAVGEMSKNKDWGVPVDEYMITEFAPIEDVIDLSNIHASLFEMVDGAEKRYAGIIAAILKDDPSRVGIIEEKIEAVGKDMHFPAGMRPKDTCLRLQEVLLDGMPCDRGSEIRDVSDNECRLIRNTDLHSAYFVEAGMDGNLYYRFLEAFVRGLLMEYTYKAEEQFRTSLMIVE